METTMKRPGFWLLVGIPWLVTIGTLFINLWINNTDAGVTWTVVALVFTILTGALPGCLKYTLKRPLTKRVWLHIVVGDVSLVATAVATALASDDGQVTMWIAICANALSAVGSHLVFVFWDDTDRIPRLGIPRLEPNPRPENIGSKSILNKNNEFEVVYFYPDGTPYTATTAAPKSISLRCWWLSWLLLLALFLFWFILSFVTSWHLGSYVYMYATILYGLIVFVGDHLPEDERSVWRALKVTLLGVGILASSHSIGLGRVDDNDTRLALDWTSFMVIQLLAVLAHATT